MLVPPTDGGTGAARDAGVTVTEAASDIGGASDGPETETILLVGGALVAVLGLAYVAGGGL